MGKYLIFSLDDGTIYDKQIINLLNKYGFCGVFNLNSGLSNYVRFSNGVQIERLNFNKEKDIYKNHEVASHTLTHPYLTNCSDEEIINQVQSDINNLETIFKVPIKSFAIPFDSYDERIINVVKNHTSVTNIRLPEIDESFDLPKDLFHIKCTCFEIEKAFDLFKGFINDKKENSLFIYAGHSYDFYLDDSFERFEDFLKLIKSYEDKFKNITFKEFVDIYPLIKYKSN